MDFKDLRLANIQRCNQSYHIFNEWEPWDWSNALAGEVGEACNITKKMLRARYGVRYGVSFDKACLGNLEDALAGELADVVIYTDLTAARIGRSLEEIVRFKFNKTSDAIGSQIKL